MLGKLEVWCGKVACWSTKAAISLKRVKTDEKLIWMAYRNSPTLFRTVPSSTPCGLPFPKIGVRNPNPKLQSLLGLSQERLKLYGLDCKFGRRSHRAIRTKADEKCGRKGSVGVSRDCPNFLVPPIISGTGKATNFKFCTLIHTKAH